MLVILWSSLIAELPRDTTMSLPVNPDTHPQWGLGASGEVSLIEGFAGLYVIYGKRPMNCDPRGNLFSGVRIKSGLLLGDYVEVYDVTSSVNPEYFGYGAFVQIEGSNGFCCCGLGNNLKGSMWNIAGGILYADYRDPDNRVGRKRVYLLAAGSGFNFKPVKSWDFLDADLWIRYGILFNMKFEHTSNDTWSTTGGTLLPILTIGLSFNFYPQDSKGR